MSIASSMVAPQPKKPTYSRKEEGFYQEIRKRVDAYFEKNHLSKRGGLEITLKTIALFVLLIGSYSLLLSHLLEGWALFFCGLIFGLTHVLIVFNIAHDASHLALFENPKLNKILSYTFNLVGANAYLWNLTHNRIHHSYPNVCDYDADIHQQAPLIRVSPTVPHQWYHRFQPYYAPFLYLFYSIFLVFSRDFQVFGLLPKPDSILIPQEIHPRKEFWILILSKIFYYTYTLVIPYLVLDIPLGQFLLAYVGIHFIMSLLLVSVLTPVHLVDEAEFAIADAEGNLDDSWAVHVFKNTTDYSRNSKLANLLFGGLNTHLVHHLFPKICHVHYIALSEILKKTAQEFNLEYREVSMAGALASHFRLLQRMSKKP